jgi:hypothetical protein
MEPLMPRRLAGFGLSPALIGATFTTASVLYALSARFVSQASARVPVKRVVAFGSAAMATSLLLTGLAPNAIPAAAGFCLLSVSFAFTLNPSTAELGNAVDRLGLACYAAVYAIYNIAYALGMLGSSIPRSSPSEWGSCTRCRARPWPS